MIVTLVTDWENIPGFGTAVVRRCYLWQSTADVGPSGAAACGVRATSYEGLNCQGETVRLGHLRALRVKNPVFFSSCSDGSREELGAKNGAVIQNGVVPI